VDFSFTEEQEMLRDEARSFLTAKFPIEAIVAAVDSNEALDRGAWREIAGLGWIGLSSPESAGGAGMNFLAESVLFEELGRALWPGPYFSTVALCLPALEGAPDLLAEVIAGEKAFSLAWAEPAGPLRLTGASDFSTKAVQGPDGWTLSGDKILVSDAGAVDSFVVAASTERGPALFAAPGAVEVSSTVDTTRRFGTVRWDDDPATMLWDPEATPAVMKSIEQRALAGLALEAVGVAQVALDLAVEHAGTRHQFDKPIGAYQAVAHRVADTFVEVELARSLAYWSAWCVAEGDDQAPTAAAAAKSFASEAAVTACESSIQVHGGIGFTWEHVLHRYYKRAGWIESFDGFGANHRALIAEHLLGPGGSQ
jgi:alkylation response protein AidB-like acyl-CoA dehydrogenase